MLLPHCQLVYMTPPQSKKSRQIQKCSTRCLSLLTAIPLTKNIANHEEEDGEDKFNYAYNACIGQDACGEYLFGYYCIATVKRYFSENKYHSTIKGAYQVFVANYNRVLDYHSFDDNRESAGMRHTEVTRPPLCMK